MAIIFDIDIFHRNLELLRSMTGLSKRNLCHLLKIENAYRKDFKTLGLKMEIGITNNFEGVDREWLLREHPEGPEGIKFTPWKKSLVDNYPVQTMFWMNEADKWKDKYETCLNQLKAAESQAQYKSEEEFMAQWPEEIKNACHQVKKILLSDHRLIKPALLSNLAAFEDSIDQEKSHAEEIRDLSERLKPLEQWHKAEQGTGTEEAASSNTGKRET